MTAGAEGRASRPSSTPTPGVPITEEHATPAAPPSAGAEVTPAAPPSAGAKVAPAAPPSAGGDTKIFLKDRQKGLVARFIDEVLNAHDADALARFITPDFADGTPEPGFGAGGGGMRDWLNAVFTGFPDMRWTASLMLYEEDNVVVRMVATGTHLGVFRGVAPTGRPVRMEAVHIVGLRDGRMASHFRIADELSLMEQITG